MAVPALATALALVIPLLSASASGTDPQAAAAQAAASKPASTPDTSLLTRAKDNLQQERALLLQYVYREKRRPLRVSTFGKVTVGDEETFEVQPSRRSRLAAARADCRERPSPDRGGTSGARTTGTPGGGACGPPGL